VNDLLAASLAAAGFVEVRGELLVAAARTRALVNRGAHGVATCEALASLPDGTQLGILVATYRPAGEPGARVAAVFISAPPPPGSTGETPTYRLP
jgi:hypothetical protein